MSTIFSTDRKFNVFHQPRYLDVCYLLHLNKQSSDNRSDKFFDFL